MFKKGQLNPAYSHGKRRSKEYAAWDHMKQRCNNPSNHNFKNYGARGIKVCDSWTNSFEQFIADMGPAPSDNHSLDRIDNNGNYEPGNCKWSTFKEQQENRTNNIYVEFNGLNLTLSEWSKRTGIPKTTISGRIKRGLPPERILKAKANPCTVITTLSK
jgi:hypothetical protein